MIQKGSKDLGMSNTKKNQRPMEENKIQKLNMTLIFIIFIDTITSMQEKYNGVGEIRVVSIITLIKISPQRKIRLGTYKNDYESFPMKGGIFAHQNHLISGSSSQYQESALNGSEHIPRFSQSLEFHNLCHNSIISC